MTTTIKQYRKNEHNTVFVIRARRSYDKRLSFFLSLYNVARADFSDLQPDECEVVQCAGERIKGMHSLEFERDCDPPDGYAEIQGSGLERSSQASWPQVGSKH